MNKKPYNSRVDTKKHIKTVRHFLNKFRKLLAERGKRHDASKLKSPEKEAFDEFTPRLAESTYGSDEYKNFLKEMGSALDHHYFHNRHHPEYFLMGPEANAGCVQSPLERMSLIDIVEMLMDWKAASMRHDNGDIIESIKLNQGRFGYSEELKRILLNTVHAMELDK